MDKRFVEKSPEEVIVAEGVSRYFTGARQYFSTTPRPVVRAVDEVSFRVKRGECFAIVGESGSGKSSLARLVVGLLDPTAGEVRINGISQASLSSKDKRAMRRNVQLVLQDPRASLDPRMTIFATLREALQVHKLHPGREAQTLRIETVIRQVGLSLQHLHRFPHELSGGQRQRAAIARAVICEPEILVLDEPVSALDVSVQAQIINLLQDLQRDLGLTYVMITHDLALVAHMADQVGVMYLGRFVEQGSVNQVCGAPRHPYTQSLMSLVPENDPLSLRHVPPVALRGAIPSPLAVPSGCAFHTRCPRARQLAESGEVRGVITTPEGEVPRRCAEDAPPAETFAEGDAAASCHFITYQSQPASHPGQRIPLQSLQN